MWEGGEIREIVRYYKHNNNREKYIRHTLRSLRTLYSTKRFLTYSIGPMKIMQQ